MQRTLAARVGRLYAAKEQALLSQALIAAEGFVELADALRSEGYDIGAVKQWRLSAPIFTASAVVTVNSLQDLDSLVTDPRFRQYAMDITHGLVGQLRVNTVRDPVTVAALQEAARRPLSAVDILASVQGQGLFQLRGRLDDSVAAFVPPRNNLHPKYSAPAIIYGTVHAEEPVLVGQ